VAVLGRDEEKLERVTDQLRADHPGRTVVGVRCDLTDDARVQPAFEEAARGLGQVDLVVYCAGVMPDRPADPEAAFRAAREMFEVNVLGAIHLLELAADHMAAAGGGTVAALGSVAGERVRKGNPAYGASKAALHAYLEGLRFRLHGTGVKVVTVKPGFVNTRMLAGRPAPGAIEPAEAARRIADGIRRGRESFFVPGWWGLVGLALRSVPRPLFKRIGPE